MKTIRIVSWAGARYFTVIAVPSKRTVSINVSNTRLRSDAWWIVGLTRLYATHVSLRQRGFYDPNKTFKLFQLRTFLSDSTLLYQEKDKSRVRFKRMSLDRNLDEPIPISRFNRFKWIQWRIEQARARFQRQLRNLSGISRPFLRITMLLGNSLNSFTWHQIEPKLNWIPGWVKSRVKNDKRKTSKRAERLARNGIGQRKRAHRPRNTIIRGR